MPIAASATAAAFHALNAAAGFRDARRISPGGNTAGRRPVLYAHAAHSTACAPGRLGRRGLADRRDDALLDALGDGGGLLVLVRCHDIGRPHDHDGHVLRGRFRGVGHELERAQDRPVEIDVEHFLVEHHRAEVDRGDVVEADGVPLALREQILVFSSPLDKCSSAVIWNCAACRLVFRPMMTFPNSPLV